MTTELINFSNALAAAAQTAGQSTVRIEARSRLAASGIVWSADGVVVTAHHVVQRDDQIQVGLPDGGSAPAQLVGRDPTTDLAVLRSQANSLAPAAWSQQDPQVGHLVLALGRPGQGVQAALGIVSAAGGEWRTPGGGRIDRYLRADLTMYPGFSGGPLVNSAGEFVGMNTSALLRGENVTIPALSLRRIVETLLAHGHVRRGYLGVGVQPVRLSPAVAPELGQETAVLVNSVEINSPAELSGLFVGDVLAHLDGQPIRDPDDLAILLQSLQAGKAVESRIVRGGQVLTISLSIGERA